MIQCAAKRDKSIFISSRGYITPCCFIYGYDEKSAIKIDNVIQVLNNTTKPSTPLEKIRQKTVNIEVEQICRVCYDACDDSMEDHPFSKKSYHRQFQSNQPE